MNTHKNSFENAHFFPNFEQKKQIKYSKIMDVTLTVLVARQLM